MLRTRLRALGSAALRSPIRLLQLILVAGILKVFDVVVDVGADSLPWDLLAVVIAFLLLFTALAIYFEDLSGQWATAFPTASATAEPGPRTVKAAPASRKARARQGPAAATAARARGRRR